MIDRARIRPMESKDTRVRVGAVSYLNSKPLIEGLGKVTDRGELIALADAPSVVLDVPSRLADALARGDLDVALIPSIEAFGNPDYEVVSDACVATRGPVLSVKLYARVPPGQIRTLALDEGSRSSATLVRVMLAQRYGVAPALSPLPLGSSIAESTADAVLLIGDRAIRPPQEVFHTVWDLGEEWLRWTGLPFVFAMWVTRSTVNLRGVDVALAAARNRGVGRLAEIARREAAVLGLDERTAYDYLSRNLHFRLGSAEQNGLRLFRRLAAGQGLIPENSEIRFREDGAGRRGLVCRTDAATA